jgi:hypothetical protein
LAFIHLGVESGAVDEDIEAAELIDGSGGHCGHSVGLGDVGGAGEGLASSGCDASGGSFGFGRIHVNDEDGGAGFGQRTTKLAPQQSAAASNDGDTAAEIERFG